MEPKGKMYFDESGNETGYYKELKKQGSRLFGYGDGKVVPVMTSLTFQRIHPDAVLPKYAKDGDSGMDVYAIEDIMLVPGETAVIPLGLLAAIPRHPFHELGYRWEIQARPRTGVSSKTSIRVANSPGTVDNTYRGELKVILDNIALPAYELDHERDEVMGEITRVDIVQQREYHTRGVDGIDWPTEEKWTTHPRGTVTIHKGDRFAQIVLAEVIRPMEIVEGIVDTDTDRGGNGFGSTGVRG